MKIRFEGSAAEFEAFFGRLRDAFAPSAAPVAAEVPPAVPEPVSAPEVADDGIPAEISQHIMPEVRDLTQAHPVPVMMPNSLRSRVLAEVRQSPYATASEIGRAVGVDQEQVRGAMKFLIRVGSVERQLNAEGGLALPHRYFATGTSADAAPAVEAKPELSRSAILRGLILEHLSGNPGQTSRHLSDILQTDYNSVSSMTTKLTGKGELVTTGAGGNKDPFRYSIA